MSIFGIFGGTKSKDHKKQQMIVLKGIGLGALIFVAALFVLKTYFPEGCAVCTTGAKACCGSLMKRISWGLQWNVLPLMSVFGSMLIVSLSRMFSDAINPLKGKESEKLIINKNILQNSLEQFVLFFASSMAFVTLCPKPCLKAIPIMAIIFLLGRVLFRIGYHKDPLQRGAGFAVTVFSYIGFLFFDLYKVLDKFVF